MFSKTTRMNPTEAPYLASFTPEDVLCPTESQKTEAQFSVKNIGPTTILSVGLGMFGIKTEEVNKETPKGSSYIVPVRPVSEKPSEVKVEYVPLNIIDKRLDVTSLEEVSKKVSFSRSTSNSAFVQDRIEKPQSSSTDEELEDKVVVPDHQFPSICQPKYTKIEFMKRVNAVAATLEAATADEMNHSCWTITKKWISEMFVPSHQNNFSRITENSKLLYWHQNMDDMEGTLSDSPIKSADYVVVNEEDYKKYMKSKDMTLENENYLQLIN